MLVFVKKKKSQFERWKKVTTGCQTSRRDSRARPSILPADRASMAVKRTMRKLRLVPRLAAAREPLSTCTFCNIRRLPFQFFLAGVQNLGNSASHWKDSCWPLWNNLLLTSNYHHLLPEQTWNQQHQPFLSCASSHRACCVSVVSCTWPWKFGLPLTFWKTTWRFISHGIHVGVMRRLIFQALWVISQNGWRFCYSQSFHRRISQNFVI